MPCVEVKRSHNWRIPPIAFLALILIGEQTALAWKVCEPPSSGSGQLPSATIQRLKQATVFIKLEAGRLSATGTGFVIKQEDEAAYIVTNHHVIDATGEMIRFGPRGRLEFVKVRASNPVILTVFRSGSKQERSLNATLVASDPSRDLAVLKVNGVKDFAQAIDLEDKPELIETMPVYMFGFPFGKMLSLKDGNPAITISKGSISSIRENERDDVKAVQIDGALNPGNSGGPVVDERGRLVGIAVATIRGSGIGMAISSDELQRMLLGRIGGVSFTKKSVANKTATIAIQARLIDPMNRLQAVFVHHAKADPTAAKPRIEKKSGFSPLAGAQDLELKIEGQLATGTLEMPIGDGYDITYQMGFINGAGTKVYTAAANYHVDDRMASAPVARRGLPVPISGSAGRMNRDYKPPTGTALYAEGGSVGEPIIHEAQVNVNRAPGCLCWSADGSSFYVLDTGGVLRQLAWEGMNELAHKDLEKPGSWLAQSAEGLLVTVPSAQEVWLLDKGLEVTRRFPIAGCKEVVSAPTLSYAFAFSSDGADTLTVLDLHKGEIASQEPLRSLGLIGRPSHPTVTPDGKYLFVQSGMEELCRLRIEGNHLKVEQNSPRIAANGQAIEVSADSRFVCLPSGGGNTGAGSYATYVYPVKDVTKPQIVLASGAYPRAVGFDSKGGFVYAQNHQKQLIVFNPRGVKLKEFAIGGGGDVRQFLVHPDGRKLIVLTDRKLYGVELPQ